MRPNTFREEKKKPKKPPQPCTSVLRRVCRGDYEPWSPGDGGAAATGASGRFKPGSSTQIAEVHSEGALAPLLTEGLSSLASDYQGPGSGHRRGLGPPARGWKCFGRGPRHSPGLRRHVTRAGRTRRCTQRLQQWRALPGPHKHFSRFPPSARVFWTTGGRRDPNGAVSGVR